MTLTIGVHRHIVPDSLIDFTADTTRAVGRLLNGRSGGIRQLPP